ncbi:MAG: MBL fold metallo-hydrolase [Myxococcales bacterium]|nr:MBL fold metallo-hydrolase [Myxococcales bacterium]
MKIHHLNCATFCPPLVGTRLNDHGMLVCHCLLIESPTGLILVDTGLGKKAIEHPALCMPPGMAWMLGPALNLAETAAQQIERLGFSPRDVRHVLVTHLDFDHAGGLSDFPEAAVHVFEDEYQAAMRPSGLMEKARYCEPLWEHGPRWQRHRLQGGEPWFGFARVRALPDVPGLADELLIVPVQGHSRGHCAIAVKGDTGWLLHCGDAYFYHGELEATGRRCTALLSAFQNIAQVDGEERRHNQERLRQLALQHGNQVQLFCAHDPSEFRRFSDGKP